MKEIQDIIAVYESSTHGEEAVALATVVHIEGSSYRRIGARMLVFEDGRWLGGVSGGCLEKDVLRKAKLALFENETQYVRYDTSTEQGQGIGVGLGCNGIIDVFICPIVQSHPHNPITILRECVSIRDEAFIMTVINPGDTKLQAGVIYHLPAPEKIRVDFPTIAVVKNFELEYNKLFQQKKSKLCQFSTNLQVLLEYFPPTIHLVICGGNYDIIPLLKFAQLLGWKTTVVANLMEVHQNIPPMANVFLPQDEGSLKIDKYTAILLMAHDIETDKINLERYFKSPAPYIGLLGPRNRTERIVRELGIQEKTTDHGLPVRIFGPMGIDIGANNPEEIALSILAEIKATFSECSTCSLRTLKRPIHERFWEKG